MLSKSTYLFLLFSHCACAVHGYYLEEEEYTENRKERVKEKKEDLSAKDIALCMLVIGSGAVGWRYYKDAKNNKDEPVDESLTVEQRKEKKAQELIENGSLEEIDQGLLEAFQEGEGCIISIIYGSSSYDGKLNSAIWVKKNRKDGLLSFFSQRILGHLLEKSVDERRLDDTEWLMKNASFSDEAKIKTLHTALRRNYADFLDIFDEKIKLELIRKHPEDEKIEKFFSKKQYRKALSNIKNDQTIIETQAHKTSLQDS